MDSTCVLVSTATNYACLVASCRRFDSAFIIVPSTALGCAAEESRAAMDFGLVWARVEHVCAGISSVWDRPRQKKDNGWQGLYAPTWWEQAPGREVSIMSVLRRTLAEPRLKPKQCLVSASTRQLRPDLDLFHSLPTAALLPIISPTCCTYLPRLALHLTTYCTITLPIPWRSAATFTRDEAHSGHTKTLQWSDPQPGACP